MNVKKNARFKKEHPQDFNLRHFQSEDREDIMLIL